MPRLSEVTKVHPITQRGTDLVMAWIFTLTLREGGQEAMDTVTVQLAEADRKPLAEWRRREVDALVTGAQGSHPRALGLRKVLDARLAIEERTDFDLGSLQP